METSLPPEVAEKRKTTHNIHPLILGRWSPRSMTGESIAEKELMTLLEAAHWAPSSYNAQPWRFIYAFRETPEWDQLLSVLVRFNQEWAVNAGALILVVSHKVFEHNQKSSVTHSFDAGAAWGYLALQGHANSLVVHGMQGFDYEKARELCKVPEDYQVECMVAVGKRGEKEDLPSTMQEKETPSTRKPLSEVVMKGSFT